MNANRSSARSTDAIVPAALTERGADQRVRNPCTDAASTTFHSTRPEPATDSRKADANAPYSSAVDAVMPRSVVVVTGLEGGLALGLVALDQLLDPVTADLVVAATSLFERPSTFTDKITSSASDMGHLQKARCKRCRGTGANYVVEPDTSERAKPEPQAQHR